MQWRDDDAIWPYFAALWNAIGATPNLVLIGGYSIFLRRQWIVETNTTTAVSSSRWPIGRSTEDMDFALPAELVVTVPSNIAIRAKIDALNWKEASNETNRNWQFERPADEPKVKLELQAPVPVPSELPKHRLADRHLMPKKSLGSRGIHAFPNKEAVAVAAFPTEFALSGTNFPIKVAHPINMILMKLTAMMDRLTESESVSPGPFARMLAEKHAKDVVMSAAMMIRTENDSAADLLKILSATEPFDRAREIAHSQFLNSNGWGRMVVSASWKKDEIETILELITRFFSK